METSPHRTSATRIAAAVVLTLSTVVFWRTAYPTITWWDSSSYSLAAATLGVDSPPGSLLLTLLGWPIATLSPGGSPAHALNLFAGLLAAIATTLVYVTAMRILRSAGRTAGGTTGAGRAAGAALGAALGALMFAFSGTLWDYAVKFTPYVLSATFTGLILWTMVRWWDDADRPGAWRWLAVLGFLFGLDFSVHRTNALLIPGALAWILIRRPTTLRSPRAVLAGTGALAAGLAMQMLLIPLAAFTRSPLNFTDPSNLSRFWDYVTIKQLGGSFLLQLFPRKAPFWSVQTADFLHVLSANFLHWPAGTRALVALPALAALIGLAVLWRGSRRLGAALSLVLLLQASLTVLYFNIPASYFRTFDRHYLPVSVTIALLVACGMGAVTERASALIRQRRPTVGIALVLMAAAIPAAQLATNWSAHDASNRYFTRDYAANALGGLPPNAIYFTVGDNDTFPVMYLQSVEGVRPDVTIINLSVANIPEWPDQLRRRDPSLPLSLSVGERRALADRPWTDTSVVLPVTEAAGHFGLAPGTKLPDDLPLVVKPSTGRSMLPAEVVLLDIVRANAWKRPLTFAITGTRSAMEWLAPYGRLDGLYFRIIPLRDPPSDATALRSHLLLNAQYRGYADPAVRLDDVSRRLGAQAYPGLVALLEADVAAGARDQCGADRRAILAALPLDRLDPPPESRAEIESGCAAAQKH